jgi:hypothetical protein
MRVYMRVCVSVGLQLNRRFACLTSPTLTVVGNLRIRVRSIHKLWTPVMTTLPQSGLGLRQGS